MTSAIANTLVFVAFFTALFRARLVALALIPPCALILARSTGIVDISSASHPLRWIVPLACAGLAGIAAWWYGNSRFYDVVVGARHWQSGLTIAPSRRALIASMLIFASCGPDLLALHPFFWARFAEWPLVPVQIAAGASVVAALLAPERWIKWAD